MPVPQTHSWCWPPVAEVVRPWPELLARVPLEVQAELDFVRGRSASAPRTQPLNLKQPWWRSQADSWARALVLVSTQQPRAQLARERSAQFSQCEVQWWSKEPVAAASLGAGTERK